MMEFKWDERKASANLRKQGVSFQEAATVFGDPLAITFSDPDHSEHELRFLTFRTSRANRLLVVGHTDRGGKTRIINARPITKHERVMYEQG